MNSGMQRAVMTSFLDLISCGLGAAILLFLIVVASPPAKEAPKSVPSFLVWGKVVDGPKAEIAIEYRGPKNPSWQRGSASGVSAFTAVSDMQSGGSALLMLLDPEVGEYEFRIVLINYPADRSSNTFPKVDLVFEGTNHELIEDPEPATLEIPSQESPIYRVGIKL